MSFIHLHVHSNFSFKDSTLTITDIVAAARRQEMPAVALTDRNNLGDADIRQISAAHILNIQLRHNIRRSKNIEGRSSV